MPQLQVLEINTPHLRSPLPASWGAPGVLPLLRNLTIWFTSTGPLPEAWARGWRQLEALSLVQSDRPDYGLAPPNSQLAAGLGPLPAAWAAGFPALRRLQLWGVASGGAIPAAWAESGFPLLERL